MGSVCHLVTPFDKECGDLMSTEGMPPQRFALWRSIYDEEQQAKGGKQLQTNDAGAATKTISAFIAQRKNHAKQKNAGSGTIIAKNVQQLKRVYTASTLYYRSSLLAHLFSKHLDTLCTEYPQFTRRALLSGIKQRVGENNIYTGGQFEIWERVWNEIADDYAYACTEAAQEQLDPTSETYMGSKSYKRDELFKILSNWNSLLYYARTVLKTIEGVALDNYDSTFKEVSAASFNANSLEELFELEELPRDHWQIAVELMSAYSTLTPEVRKLVSRIPDRKLVHGRWQTRTDDLGYTVYLRSSEAFNKLLNTCRYIRSEQDMMLRLQTDPFFSKWIMSLSGTTEEEAKMGAQLRGMLYVGLKRTFQEYTATVKVGKRWRVKYLNHKKQTHSNVLSNSKKGRTLTAQSIYDNNGAFNVNNLSSLITKIDEALGKPSDHKTRNTGELGWFWRDETSRKAKREFLVDTFQALGVWLSAEEANQILLNQKATLALIHELHYAISKGFSNKAVNIALKTGQSYYDLLNAKPVNKNGQDKNALKEHLLNAEKILEETRNSSQAEMSVLWKNDKKQFVRYFSYIQEGFMSERIDTIKSFIEDSRRGNDAEAKADLKKWIEDTYKGDPFFYDSKKGWLNSWIKWIISCCEASTPLHASTLASITYYRDLGSWDLVFEKFHAKQYLESILAHFFQFQSSKLTKNIAEYPVFILGDAATSKFIKAPKHNIQEFGELFYNIALQEKKRQQLIKAANAKLKSLGIDEGIETFSEQGGKWILLPFLNEEKYKVTFRDSKDKIMKSIIEYLTDSMQSFIQSTQARLGREAYSEEQLKTFYLNYKYATIQQLEMFTIDTAFFPNSKTLQKRYKQEHASGFSLNVDAIDIWRGLNQKYSKDGIQRSVYFLDVEHEAHPDFLRMLELYYKKGTPEYALYLKNSLTNGQGLRTLDGYRKVYGMSLLWNAQYEQAYQEIKKIRNQYKGTEIPAFAIQKIEDLAKVFQPIKPFMFTFEKLALNDNTYILIPVQHKYAEVILIPELLPEGSKLKDLAEWMDTPDANGNTIDLAIATTGVKVGNFGAVDIGSPTTQEELVTSLSKAYVHCTDFADLRIQGNPLDHLYSEGLVGTQSRKLIPQGIIKDKDYSYYIGGRQVNLNGEMVNLSGQNFLTFYNLLNSVNILESYDAFKKLISNPKLLAQKCIQAVLDGNKELQDHILAYTLGRNGLPNLSFFDSVLEHDSANLVWSIFRQMVSRQKMLGGSAVQASALGIQDYSYDGGLRLEIRDNNILYAEVEIPFEFSYTQIDEKGRKKQISLKYEDYCYPDGTLILDDSGKISKLEKEFPGIDTFLAYRIPTERKYSMLVCKAVRFSKKTAGAVIKVPLEGTTIAGFDFDVDKLMFLRHSLEFKLTEAGNRESNPIQYDYTIPVEKNSRTQRDNMLLDLMIARLQDVETLKERITPGGFRHAIQAAKEMQEIELGDLSFYDDIPSWEEIEKRTQNEKYDPEPQYDPSEPETLLIYMEQNMIAAQVIGMSANQNSNNAITSLFEKFSLKEPISLCGHSYFDLLASPEGWDAAQELSEMLTASVDAVKNPVLNFLNINTVTADCAMLLLRLGFSYREIGSLFNQPIIKEICQNCFNNNITLTQAIRNACIKYKVSGENMDALLVQSISALTIDNLKDNLIKYRTLGNEAYNKIPFFNEQQMVLATFSKINKAAKVLSNEVLALKNTSANSIKNNFGDMIYSFSKIKSFEEAVNDPEGILEVQASKYQKSPIIYKNPDFRSSEYLKRLSQNPVAYEQVMWDCIYDATVNVFGTQFPYFTKPFVNLREDATNSFKSNILYGQTINSLHAAFRTALLSKYQNGIFDGNRPTFYLDENGEVQSTTQKEYYIDYFPEILFSLYQNTKALQNTFLFQVLSFGTNLNTGKMDITMDYDYRGNKTLQEDFTDAWAMLFEGRLVSTDIVAASTQKQLAIDLFVYDFFKSAGASYATGRYGHLTPVSLKTALMITEDTSYTKAFNDMQEGKLTIDNENFLKLWMMNSLYNTSVNTSFIFKASSNETLNDLIQNKITEGKQFGEVQEQIRLDLSRYKSSIAGSLRRETDAGYVYSPIIRIDYVVDDETVEPIYYIAAKLGPTEHDAMTYYLIDKFKIESNSISYNQEWTEFIDDALIQNVTEQVSIEKVTEDMVGSAFDFSMNNEEADIQEKRKKLALTALSAALTQVQNQARSSQATQTSFSIQSELQAIRKEITALDTEQIKTRQEAEEQELQDLIETIKDACMLNGVILMDKNGEIAKGC